MISEMQSHAAAGLAGPPMVEVRDLHKSYGAIEAVKGASLTVKRGEAHFIIGPSGCGKSTLLRCINLLEEPNSRQHSSRRHANGVWPAGEGHVDPRSSALSR